MSGMANIYDRAIEASKDAVPQFKVVQVRVRYERRRLSIEFR